MVKVGSKTLPRGSHVIKASGCCCYFPASTLASSSSVSSFSQTNFLSEDRDPKDEKLKNHIRTDTMESNLLGEKRYKEAIASAANGDYNKALWILEDLLLDPKEGRNSTAILGEQGNLLMELAVKEGETVLAFPYMFGAAGCFSADVSLSDPCARVFKLMGKEIGSVLYLKKCLVKAKQALSLPSRKAEEKKKRMENLVEEVENMIAFSKNVSDERFGFWELRNSPEPPLRLKDERKELRSFWVGLDVNLKRDFMKVRIEELLCFVKEKYHIKGRDFVKQVLASAKKDRKWNFLVCRSRCSKKFSCAEDCKTHFEQEHAADFKPSSEEKMVMRIGKAWARKISDGGWEPVDTVAAVEMIENRLKDVKGFVSGNRWSKEWPLAADERRSKLLREIKTLLKSLCDQEILSCSVRDWMMCVLGMYLKNLNVSEQSVHDLHLLQTPQSICFLESHELNQILSFLECIKRKRDDGTDQVSRAVDSVLSMTSVKEKIDFDPDFSFLLLDKRLLKRYNAPFDDGGTIDVFDPNVHYSKAHAQGDDFISWLVDYSSVDKIFPRPIREHSLDIWLSVKKAIQFTCRTLGTKYAKRKQLDYYDKALTSVGSFCMSEHMRRKDLQEDQRNKYASLLYNRCEEMVSSISPTTPLFLCAVRDVLKGASHPTVDLPDFVDCLNFIRERRNISDEIVLKSIDLLKSVLNNKVLLIDSKILLIDNSRISLLNNLVRLSVFDNRSYVLQVLKPFLLNGIHNMQAKVKSDAVAADILREQVKSQLKTKKNKNQVFKALNSQQRTSTSVSGPLDKTVEHEPEVTSPSLKTVEEDSMGPAGTLASERGLLENSSKSDKAAKVDHEMQNMPGESSLSEHLGKPLGEAAVRYNSAFDMTVKALLNIEVLKEDLKDGGHDDLEEQVPCALQDFFSAFKSEEIKNEGVYSFLLGELLAYLELAHCMSSDVAGVLVAILELWHSWKNRGRESLVTRLFTLEENERLDCRKCGRKSNYPDQSSYGIVTASNSVRDLKYALGKRNFVDILKVICVEYKMLCDVGTGGCGKTNFVHRTIRRCPPIFTIVLEWEKSETEEEISETTKALEWEIDISRLYEGVERNTNYRLVSMVGYGEKEEHICITYEVKRQRWINLRRESLEGEVVGNWESVVGFCGERKVRPEILFYEAARSIA